jgi:hypothetical protein
MSFGVEVGTNGEAFDWCRHCGVPGQLTAEHIPPRSSNNDSPVGRVVNPFKLDAVVQEVAAWNEGHVVSTLDPTCNHRASKWGYVKEYRRWFRLFEERARSIARLTHVDPLRGTEPFEIRLPYDVQPARFARQVLGMFLAVQSTKDLFTTHSTLSELIGPDPSDGQKRRSTGLDIAPLHLYLSVYNANWKYLNQGMLTVETSLDRDGRLLPTPPQSLQPLFSETFILCLAPFAFVLTTRNAHDQGHEISDWTKWSVDLRLRKNQLLLVLPTADRLHDTLRAMVYPDDYVIR